MSPSLLWLRRDLRRADHPALAEASAAGPVAPLFVVDPVLWARSGVPRRAWVAATVLALREDWGGALGVRLGRAGDVVPQVAADVGATAVHVTGETTPYGTARDAVVRSPLEVPWIETGSAYAVSPGRVGRSDGSAYRVFGAFARAWFEHGWPSPAESGPAKVLDVGSDPAALDLLHRAATEVTLPAAGEASAWRRWAEVLPRLEEYADQRDRPDLDGTSMLSPHLKVGSIHPRSLLADLDLSNHGHRVFATELAWREFYADLLHRAPTSAWADLRPLSMQHDDSPDARDLWQRGHTGYPIVDAGMRQLAETGWMHNRVRMITASFFCKDLHEWWPRGARWFLNQLIDGDVASNSHGWQWTAGTGTDPAPYFRIFNPVLQGKRFDPHGDYVRRWVPELAHLSGATVHEPWRSPDGYAHGYPQRMVDHAAERAESLRRYRGE